MQSPLSLTPVLFVNQSQRSAVLADSKLAFQYTQFKLSPHSENRHRAKSVQTMETPFCLSYTDESTQLLAKTFRALSVHTKNKNTTHFDKENDTNFVSITAAKYSTHTFLTSFPRSPISPPKRNNYEMH